MVKPTCHPGFVSGSLDIDIELNSVWQKNIKGMLNLLQHLIVKNPETILKQVQHRARKTIHTYHAEFVSAPVFYVL
jgi:hypothetical protein